MWKDLNELTGEVHFVSRWFVGVADCLLQSILICLPSNYCGEGILLRLKREIIGWMRLRGLLKKVVRAMKDDTETKWLQDEFFMKI